MDAKSEGEVEEITPINCEVGEWELHPANGKPCVFQTGNLKCFSSNVRSIAVEPAHGGEECTEPAIIAGERAKRVVTRCSPVRNCFLYMA